MSEPIKCLCGKHEIPPLGPSQVGTWDENAIIEGGAIHTRGRCYTSEPQADYGVRWYSPQNTTATVTARTKAIG